MDLFQRSAEKRQVHQPLAERLRPVSLDEFIGQEHLLGPGKWLSQFGQGDSLPSFIFWGPPGSGKTTLAKILAKNAGGAFDVLSAVAAGVKDIRQVVELAAQRRNHYDEKTVLFLDEIHRFTKAQQDALLPHVESGVITLIGATTENPSFHVNAALLSRARVLRMETLSEEQLNIVIDTALKNTDKGLGESGLDVTTEGRAALLSMCQGDARRLLNTLEVAAALTSKMGDTFISRKCVDEAAQSKTLLYDKSGDEHYGVVSAFIKSMRGSDPDAAVYWMTRMLEAGEDPLFILRRLVIFASEDVGNADPQALSVAVSALNSFKFIGLPEGVLPMTQAVMYMAYAPKSNSALASYAKVRKVVMEYGSLPVPDKLKNVTSGLAQAMGHGKGYKYPHEYSGHYVKEEYLPEKLAGQRLVQISDSGFEQQMQDHQKSRMDKTK